MAHKNDDLIVFDIGARGGAHRSWQHVGLPLNYVLFEPEASEFVALKELAAGSDDLVRLSVVNRAIDERSGERSLNVYQQPDLSSFFELTPGLSYRYGRVRLERRVPVQTTTLVQVADELSFLPDFLSIDAQGATLAILKGAGAVLDRVVALRCEAEFFALYRDAPLFDSVFRFLQGRGFDLARLEMCGMPKAGISTEMNRFSVGPTDARPAGCDALFVNGRRLDRLLDQPTDLFNAQRIAGFAVFAIHNGFGYHGLEVLEELDRRTDLRAFMAGLPKSVRETLLSTVAAYLLFPRSNVNTGFDGRAAYGIFDDRDVEATAMGLPEATRAKLATLYAAG